VVCSRCSSHRVPLIRGAPDSRVCDKCYVDILQRQRPADGTAGPMDVAQLTKRHGDKPDPNAALANAIAQAQTKETKRVCIEYTRSWRG